MKKALLITFLFLGLGVGEELSSVTNEEVFSILKWHLNDLIEGMRQNEVLPEILKLLYKDMDCLSQVSIRSFLEGFFPSNLLFVEKILSGELDTFYGGAIESSISYCLYQIVLFRIYFLVNKDCSGLEYYLENQKNLILDLINKFFSGENLERIKGEFETYCANKENKWFKNLTRTFWDAKSRFRAVEFKEYLENWTAELRFVINVRTTDVMSRFPYSCKSLKFPSLMPWVQAKGLRPGKVTCACLLGMLWEEPDIIKLVLNRFKIHLMPREDDVLVALVTFIKAFINEYSFQSYISSFKVKALLEEVSCREGCPKIVIYVNGRGALKAVLEKVCEVFKGWPGLERAPAFNEKAGEIVYFAQGDRFDKILWPGLYESPNRVYFDEDKIRRLIK